MSTQARTRWKRSRLRVVWLGLGCLFLSCSQTPDPFPTTSRLSSAVRNGEPSVDRRVGALYSFTPTIESVSGDLTRCYLRQVYLATATLLNDNVLITVMHNQSYGGEGPYFSTLATATEPGDETRDQPPEARALARTDHLRPTEFGEEDGISLIKLSSSFVVSDPPTLDTGDWSRDEVGRIIGYGRSADLAGIGTRRYGDQPFQGRTTVGNLRFARGSTGAIGCEGDSGSGRWREDPDLGMVLSGIAYLGDVTCGTSLEEEVDFSVTPLADSLSQEAEAWRHPISCLGEGDPQRDHIYSREGCGGRADLGPGKHAYYSGCSDSCGVDPDYSGLDSGGQLILSGNGSSSWDLADLCDRNSLSGGAITLCEYDSDSGTYLPRRVECPCRS